jgi:hypothetical protein
MSARLWSLRILTLGCMLTGCLMLGESVASAAVTHEYLSQITEVPALGPHGEAIASPGELGTLTSLALDSGHLWLAEQREVVPRIDEFDAASGAFLSQPGVAGVSAGLAIAHASGDIYVPSDEGHSGEVLVLDAAGSLIGSWTGTDTESKAFGCFGCGTGESVLAGESVVAVDNSTVLGDWAAGDVYVTDVANDVVDVFEPEAGGKERLATELKGTSPGEPFVHPQQVAVSAFNGDVLVGDASGIDIFKPAAIAGQYEFVGKLVGPPPGGSFTQIRSLAVDGSDGDIYVAEAQALYEFDATGAYLGKIAGADTPAGNFHSLQSLAVDPTTDHLFVGDYREGHGDAVDVFGPNLVVPDVTTGSALGVGPFAATLTGTVNPDKAGNATCQFVWGTSMDLLGSPPVACSQSVADGGSPVAVQGALTDLQPDTTYYYRLQATDAQGTNVGEGSDDREFTTPGPGIREEGASDVASTSVSLNAAIDPHGLNTTYYFQYGLSTAYGTDIPTPPGASIGSGVVPVDVVQHVQEGLSVGVTYHYRVVALSELEPGKLEAFAGPDQTFTTQAAGGSGLPDGRAWEMVSPPNKLGARLEPAPVHEGGLTQAAIDGGEIAYTASAPTEEGAKGNTSLEHIQLLASRGAAGWDTKVIATPHEAASGLVAGSLSEYLLFSPDLSLGIVEPKGETPLSAEASERTPYLRHDKTCQSSPGVCYQPLVTVSNVLSGTKFGGDPKDGFGEVIVEGASPDLSHIVLEATPPLTSVPVEHALYEWSAGRLRLVTFSPGASGTGLEGQSTLGAGQGNTRHAVSDDGSRIVWTQEIGSLSALYMRDTAKGEGETVRLDTPQPGAKGGHSEPVFQTASSDGSQVFFTDTARLTVSSGASGGEPDLYEYDAEAGSLTDLSVDLNKNESADVQGLVQGASGDGSYVYFVAKGVLVPGARSGANNLYVHHAGATTLVAILSSEDGENEGGTIAKQLVALTASVSPDGRWLAFMSDESLTGYNNHDVNNGVRDEEVFLYDAVSKRIVCASCNPTGARPVGTFDPGNTPAPLFDNSLVWHARWLAGAIPSWISNNAARGTYQSRYLSDGGRLFFDSSDGLTPSDTNGTWDVYEYEPSGIDCENTSATVEETADGCVGLISSGGSADESTFMDASEDGSEAFFLTTSQLVSQDDDHALDMYDARVCSASSPCFPVAPVGSPPCSTSDSCKPAPSPQPESFGAPSSETFAGAGNIAAPVGTPIVANRSLTRAQKLSRALKVCRKRPKRKQAACERHARKLYGKKRLGKQAAARKHARPLGPERGKR